MYITNRRLLQVSRWFLLLVCFCAGTFLLLEGNNTGLGILLLFIGLWLILDNPLEYFEILEGHCPSCGHGLRVRRLLKSSCPACRRAIITEFDGLLVEDDEVVHRREPRAIEEAAEKVSQREPVVITPGDTLDLHTFSPKEVVSLLDEFIDLSQKAEIKLVKIIHGKGTGALRRRVHSLLARDPRVVTFYHAPRKSGDWGATLVELQADQTEDGGEAE